MGAWYSGRRPGAGNISTSQQKRYAKAHKSGPKRASNQGHGRGTHRLEKAPDAPYPYLQALANNPIRKLVQKTSKRNPPA